MNSAGVYKRVLSYLRPHAKTFFLALFCMVLYGASEGALPLLIKHVLDGVFDRRDESFLKILPLILVGFALLRGLLDFGQQYYMSKVGHLVVRDMRDKVNDHLLRLSPSFYIQHSAANILSRVTSDVVMVRSLLTDSASAVLRDSIRVLALLCTAIYIDPTLALIAFVVFPVGVLPVYRFGKKLRKLSKKGQDAIGNISSLLHESMNGNKVVKIFLREDYERERFRLENESLTRTFIRSERVRALTGPVNEILAILAVSAVILYGGYSVINGTRSQGDFIAFLASLFLLYDPFKKLSRIHGTIQQGLASADRIFEVLDVQPDIVTPSSPEKMGPDHSIRFESVSFSYESLTSKLPGEGKANESDGAEITRLSDHEKREALNQIHLEIPQGSKVALVGFSGSGKSTLVDLIPRFMDPSKGKILIGGKDVASLDLNELRSSIAMVGQHTFLFHDTIFANIAYGNLAATKEEVESAARSAYAYDFIQALPHGFQTITGESGFSLSGGERQRIAIARALLKDCPILILDEATASLDNRSEREVQAALEALEKGRTTLVIAHRLSTVRDADQILVMRDGQIVERGTHEELLEKQGEYSRLYALQFSETRVKTEQAPLVEHEIAAEGH